MISALRAPCASAPCQNEPLTETCVYLARRTTHLDTKVHLNSMNVFVSDAAVICDEQMPFFVNWFVVRICNVVALIAECISIPLCPTSPMLLPLQPFPEKWCDAETL